MAAEANIAKKRKLIIIGGVIAVVAIIICIVVAVNNAKMERIEGRYTNSGRNQSIKITREGSYYLLEGIGSRDAACYFKNESCFKDKGDYVDMTFEYFVSGDLVKCRYEDDGFEEIFVFETDGDRIEFIKE